MSIYNLLEYSDDNYSMTSENLWNYYRDDIDGNDGNASEGKLFDYETKIVGKTPERPTEPRQPTHPPPNPDGS